jgi:hypothetical protein
VSTIIRTGLPSDTILLKQGTIIRVTPISKYGERYAGVDGYYFKVRSFRGTNYHYDSRHKGELMFVKSCINNFHRYIQINDDPDFTFEVVGQAVQEKTSIAPPPFPSL